MPSLLPTCSVWRKLNHSVFFLFPQKFLLVPGLSAGTTASPGKSGLRCVGVAAPTALFQAGAGGGLCWGSPSLRTQAPIQEAGAQISLYHFTPVPQFFHL